VDYKLSKLSRRLAIRLINAEYLKTGFPNGASNSQNHLLLGAGLTFRFGMHELEPAGLVVEVPRKNDLHFTCSTNLSSIIQGQTIDVSGNAFTLPDQLALTFSWSVLGQNIAGDGRQVTLNTSTLAPGEYHVRGRAVAIDDISLKAECETFFRVTARPN
jgi:hypothetical protein